MSYKNAQSGDNMNKKNAILNFLKFVFALIVGGFLGAKLLISDSPCSIIIFFIICGVGGIILSKINF